MSDVVIQVDHLWKKYRLGVLGTGTLRHDFNRWLHRVAGRPDPYARVGEGPAKIEDRRSKIEPRSPISDLPSSTSSAATLSPNSHLLSPSSSLRDDEMWALRDISFEVKQGEILGIIGRNGAGKSTLLKILSRVTAPTSGEVRVKGRIASLLEVGTGFHPELTGRENIFLNGAILGMTRAEIKGKFDEIVAFSEIEKFLDTPVKRYSSGMYVRLAFAVAAHLEPEILIVDEVLAVGDAAFQKKCLGKMGDVAKEGRTVLIVSHSMATIQRLCSSAILLDQGRVRLTGVPQDVCPTYLESGCNGSGLFWKRRDPPTDQPHFLSVSICDHAGKPLESVSTAMAVSVVMEYAIPKDYPFVQVGIGLLDANGEEIFGSAPQDSGLPSPSNAGVFRATVIYPPQIFMAKAYGIRVALFAPNHGPFEILDNIVRFSVQEVASLGNNNPGGRRGTIAVLCKWLIQREKYSEH